jgi:hypothetical protein
MPKLLRFLIPKRINQTVWFAPFAIVVGIYGYFEGYTDIGIGSVLGGVILVVFYLVNRRINGQKITGKENSLSE